MESKLEEPLVFVVPQERTNSLEILIHQVVSEETELHNVGYVMWPSAVTLSRWIAKNPAVVLNTGGGILELGAGCGLVGLTAATLLKQQQASNDEDKHPKDTDKSPENLILTDYDPAVLENLGRNISLNKLDKHSTTVAGLDFFDQPESGDDESYWVDMDGSHREQVSLILGADILCYSNDAEMVSNTIQAALVEGGQAIVINGCHRFGVAEFPEACRNAGLVVNTTNLIADRKLEGSGEEEQRILERDLDQTAGFTERKGCEYNQIMFTIDKPVAC